MSKKKKLPKNLVPANDTVRKILELALNIQGTDKEVVLRKIDKIPDFINGCQSAIDAIEQSNNLLHQSNQESMSSFHDECKIYLDTCRDLLDKGNLSTDQELEVLMEMKELIKLSAEKDSENKQFNIDNHLQTASIIGAIIVGIGAFFAGIVASKGNSSAEEQEESRELKPHYDYEE